MEFSQSIFVSREVIVRSPFISLCVSFRKPGADRKLPQQSKNGFAPLSLGLKQSSSLRALAPTGWMMMMYNEILLLVISCASLGFMTTFLRVALMHFRPGAFLPGVPVQPVLVRYFLEGKADTVTWTWDQVA